jgi:hypothetical protein
MDVCKQSHDLLSVKYIHPALYTHLSVAFSRPQWAMTMNPLRLIHHGHLVSNGSSSPVQDHSQTRVMILLKYFVVQLPADLMFAPKNAVRRR